MNVNEALSNIEKIINGSIKSGVFSDYKSVVIAAESFEEIKKCVAENIISAAETATESGTALRAIGV